MPVTLGHLKLGTLDGRQAGPQPKSATPTRLDVKEKRDKDDAKKLKVWRAEVFDRDEGKCRKCACKVVRTLSLHPRRAECHHVAGRDDRSTRYDSRAGLLVCAKCHQEITGIVNTKVLVVGTVWFTKEGARFINCDYPVTFKETK